MNKKIFKIIFVIFLICILSNSFYYITNIVYAAGIHGDEEPLDPTPPTPKPKPEPTPNPTPNPTPDPTPEPTTYSISGSVWEDVDINAGKGIFNQGDILIDGIDVTLYSSNLEKLDNTTTYNGNYNFTGLTNGDYIVEFKYNDKKYNGLTYKSAFSPNDVEASANAVDSQDRRLELMQKFFSIDYNTLTNPQNDYSMTALSDVKVEGSNVTRNFSIIKRPEYSVELTKNVTHLQIILSDGQTLIDWKPNQSAKHLMVLPDSLTAIMDDEITHGATIKIQYAITIKNTSKYDVLSNYFTESFLIQSGFSNFLSYLFDNIPTTYYLYDYINNNLIFDTSNNHDNWQFISANTTYPHSPDMDLSSETVLVNYVSLKPDQTKTFTLNASKVMTIGDTDLLTYDNYVEVVKYSSILGRVMNNGSTIPGNLNIYADDPIKESDEAKAETVTRVPPFGKDLSYYTKIVGIVILAIEIAILSILKLKIKRIRNKYIMK